MAHLFNVLIFVLVLAPSIGRATAFFPKNIILNESNAAPYILIAEKATHSLYVFESQNGSPQLLKRFKVATGKRRGDKSEQGDRKTPEGIYFFEEFLPEKELLRRYGDNGKQYGIGAFTLDYPNLFDRYQGKTGGGIWLHATDDASRIDKGLDSKGCVVVDNENLKEVSAYLKLSESQIIIVQNLQYLDEDNWKINKDRLKEFLENWQKAWEEEDLNAYLDFYDQRLFRSHKGNYQKFAQYKKSVFEAPGQPQIKLTNRRILTRDDYAIITFHQEYSSSLLQNEIGKKTLYLRKDSNYNWKIVLEKWEKLQDGALAQLPIKYFES